MEQQWFGTLVFGVAHHVGDSFHRVPGFCDLCPEATGEVLERCC